MREFLHHLLLPRESNNHKAKLLHHSSLLFLILFLFITKFFIVSLAQNHSDVLGISANITPEELLVYTNEKRAEKGLAPLVLDPRLAAAASRKAADMFTRNYWAHNAPDGATPWVFIKGAGYEYAYAGENLARGFTTSTDVITAWMNSRGHRENMLSPNYKDIGFAIVPGKLTGDDTVLVVEMFGSRYEGERQKDISSAVVVPSISPTHFPESRSEEAKKTPLSSTPKYFVASVRTQPLVNSDSFVKNIATGVLLVLLAVFALDILIIEKKKVVRIVSHHVDHIVFLMVILITILLLGGGVVL